MKQQPLERAILFGLSAGMRTTAPIVACARAERPWEWYLLLAELVIDKLPQTPSRLMPGTWFGRVATATYGGFRDAESHEFGVLESVLVAGLSAFLVTKLAHDLRRSLTRLGGLPDPCVALVEDALMLACVVRLRDRGGLSHGK